MDNTLKRWSSVAKPPAFGMREQAHFLNQFLIGKLGDVPTAGDFSAVFVQDFQRPARPDGARKPQPAQQTGREHFRRQSRSRARQPPCPERAVRDQAQHHVARPGIYMREHARRHQAEQRNGHESVHVEIDAPVDEVDRAEVAHER